MGEIVANHGSILDGESFAFPVKGRPWLLIAAFLSPRCQRAMQAPDDLLKRLVDIPLPASDWKRLVIVMGQLGDFDSMEYAQALVPRLADLEAAHISLQIFR